jgi:hypothetical protein
VRFAPLADDPWVLYYYHRPIVLYFSNLNPGQDTREQFCTILYLELSLGLGDGPRHSAHPQTSCPDTSHPSADSQLSMTRI